MHYGTQTIKSAILTTFCLKNLDTFARTPARESKMIVVARAYFTFQMLTLQKNIDIHKDTHTHIYMISNLIYFHLLKTGVKN